MPDMDRVDNREEEEEKGWIAQLGTGLKTVGKIAQKPLASTKASVLAAGLVIGGLLLTALGPGVPVALVGVMLAGGTTLGLGAFGARLSEGKRAREHKQEQAQEKDREKQEEKDFRREMLERLGSMADARAGQNQTRPAQGQNQQFQPQQSRASARRASDSVRTRAASFENEQTARAARTYTPGVSSGQGQGSPSSEAPPLVKNFSRHMPKGRAMG